MRFILLFCLAFCVLPFYGFAQWLPGGVSTTNDQVRTGVTGIGFLTPVAASTAANGRTRFLVNGTGNDGGILAHFVSGGVGNFSDKWCGLGIGNPTGTPSPYGLAIADTNSVGFYNLLRENFNGAIRKNTIAGFGISGGENTNRFIVRGYSGTGAAAGKDLLVANPNGSVGINAEPLASFWVDANETTAATTFKAMAITGATEVNPSAIKISSSSGMGSQGNTSLTNNDIAVEGSRSQIPDFVTSITNLVAGTQEGVAVNMQVVRDLNPAVVVPPVDIAPPGEYAEIYWQDLNYAGITSTAVPAVTAAPLDKLYISFRNNQNVNPFAAGNKLVVTTFQANGRVGIGTNQPASLFGLAPVLLDVNGNGLFNGNFIASDRRFKDDIRPVEGAMDKVRRLRGSTYTMRTAEFPDKHFAPGRQYGFIAQEVEEVIPEVAQPCDNGFYAVNYDALIPVLTEAIKEQDKTITDLRAEVAELRSQFSDLKAGQQPGDLKGFRLDQNAPNPTGGSATIGYALPIGTVGARITVYDLTGRTIKTWVLSDSEGQITVNANELASGLYVYDLQVGGRQVLERKMSVVIEN